MPVFNKGAIFSHSLAFFHRSAESWGPDWGPMNLLLSKKDLNSNACEAYWLPFTSSPFHRHAARVRLSVEPGRLVGMLEHLALDALAFG